MKKFLCCICIILSIFSMSYIEVKAGNSSVYGELSTKLFVEDNLFKIVKEVNITNEYETDKLGVVIKLKDNKDEIKLNSFFIEDDNNEKSDKYKLSKGYDGYRVSLDLGEKKKIKKIYLEYSYTKMNRYDKDDGYCYVMQDICGTFMDIKIDKQKIDIGDGISGCWITGGYEHFFVEGATRIINIECLNTVNNSIILSFKDDYSFFSKNSSSTTYLKDNTKDSNYVKLFNDEKHSYLGKIVDFILGLIILIIILSIFIAPLRPVTLLILSCPLVILKSVISLVKSTKNKSKSKIRYKDKVENSSNKNVTRFEDKEEIDFKMPEYINPAYLGMLFETTEEDVIFTMICELIRKEAIEVKFNSDYRDKDSKSTYRKYTLSLTEKSVELDKCESEFINKLREIDEINLINIDDIQKLVGKGYFKSIIEVVNESLDNYLRAGLEENLTLDQVLKKRKFELDKWQNIRNNIKKLKEKDIRKLTIEDIEYLHVISTAMFLRKKSFSVFKIFTPTELRVSNYFSQILKKFDNNKTIISYLESTFIR